MRFSNSSEWLKTIASVNLTKVQTLIVLLHCFKNSFTEVNGYVIKYNKVHSLVSLKYVYPCETVATDKKMKVPITPKVCFCLLQSLLFTPPYPTPFPILRHHSNALCCYKLVWIFYSFIKNRNIDHVLLFAWLLSFDICFFFCQLCLFQVVHSFSFLISMPLYGYTTVYLCTCWWTFGSFFVFEYYRLSYCEHPFASVSVDRCFHFSWANT